MYRLIGGHTNHAWGGIPELVASWRPPVWLVMNPGPEWKWVAQATPDTKFVWRVYNSNEPDFNTDLDVVTAARTWMATALPYLGNTVGGYWKGVNEPVISSPEAMARFARFEIERMKLLASYGVKAIIGGFSVGNPSNLSWWREFLPALAAGKDHGAILGLHQYWWETPSDTRFVDPAWTSLRHRFVYEGEESHGWEGLGQEYRLPCILMEAGGDAGVAEPGKVMGWASVRTPEQYKADLEAYSKEIIKDVYILGACVFCCGNSSFEWTGYDIWPFVAQSIARGSNPLYRRYAPLPEKWARGIDVSRHQGHIKWSEVWGSGVSFAFVRASVGLWKDPRYDKNVLRARRQGIVVMPYHFQSASDDPRGQAQFFVQATGVAKTRWDDVETYKNKGPDREAVKAFADECSRIESRLNGFYTSRYMWDYKLKVGNWAGGHPGWFADWNNKRFADPRIPRGWDSWEFQQITSKGKVPGVYGNVDLDIFNGGVSELRRRYGQ